MRKILAITYLVMLFPLSASVFAQDSTPPSVKYQTGAPTGAACPDGKIIVDRVTGTGYVRVSGVCQSMAGGGTPGGSNGQIQYNNNGIFGGLASVPVSSGGTGQTSYTNGQLLIGNSTGNTLTKATLTQGSNVTITNGGGSITIAAANTGNIIGWEDGTTRTVGATSTQFTYAGATTIASFNGTEGNRQSVMPFAATLGNLYIRTSGSQPSDGGMTCLIRNSTTTTDSSISVTIAANAAAGTFSDTTHSATVSAGDLITIKCINASASVSAGIFEIKLRVREN